MKIIRLISITALSCVFLVSACTWPKLGVVSVKPVETGKEYELVTTTASVSHSRPVLFGVVFGEYKSYAQLIGELMDNLDCKVLKNVELKYQVFQHTGFGHQTTGIEGECFKLKGPQ